MADLEERLRVFISSTFLDLQAHRQAVFDAMLAMGHTTEDMIYWSADERKPTTVSLDRVRNSDIVILIIAHRYGYIPDDAMHSVTEQEYNAARSFGIPVLAFLLDESIPWPPSHIEWDKRDQLAAFKNRVKAEATIRTFTSPDQLSALVSQALAGFRRKYQERELPRNVLRKLVRLDPTSSLTTFADLTIQIGTAEDDLPLLLNIRRSRDLTPEFDSLESALRRPGLEPPVALLSSFRQSLEQHATQAWARDGIETVCMKDGSAQSLFVSRAPLSHFFDSTVDALLGEGSRQVRNLSTRRRSLIASSLASSDLFSQRPTTSPTSRDLLSPTYLQSEGGANRFLGVSVRDGSVYSIGRPRDRFGRNGEGWVEWRPFIYESIPSHFPDVSFAVTSSGDTKRIPSSRYEQTLRDAIRSEGEENSPAVTMEISRVSLSAFLVRLAEAVGKWHERGAVHGDLKPSNTLLAPDGIALIDDFQLSVGQVAPGWTPGWSAPEQVIGGQVSCAADVYPFGRMIASLLGGNLAGEVRKFKVSTSAGDTKEFDVFYNPSVRCAPEHFSVPEDGLPAWIDLARRCLRFEPTERPSVAAELAEEIKNLAGRYPLKGTCQISLRHEAVLAIFLDGSTRVTRQLSIDMSTDSLLPTLGSLPPVRFPV